MFSPTNGPSTTIKSPFATIERPRAAGYFSFEANSDITKGKLISVTPLKNPLIMKQAMRGTHDVCSASTKK